MMKQKQKPILVDDDQGPQLKVVRSDATEEAQSLPQFVMKTLGELGPSLPVGVLSGKSRVRPFRLRKYKMKQEKALAELRDSYKGSPGKFVCDVLSMMLQTVGPHNFDMMKDGERQNAINQLTMPDVLYIYLYMRLEALGADSPVVMTVECPRCHTRFNWYGDLSTLDVKVVPDDTGPLTRWYTLHEPIMMRGKTVSKLLLGPILWERFSRKEFSMAASQQNSAILASICGADGIDLPHGSLVAVDGDIDDLDKFDIAGLIADIEANTPGPQIDVIPECPNCKLSWKIMLDWSWDNFFRRSARPSI